MCDLKGKKENWKKVVCCRGNKAPADWSQPSLIISFRFLLVTASCGSNSFCFQVGRYSCSVFVVAFYCGRPYYGGNPFDLENPIRFLIFFSWYLWIEFFKLYHNCNPICLSGPLPYFSDWIFHSVFVDWSIHFWKKTSSSLLIVNRFETWRSCLFFYPSGSRLILFFPLFSTKENEKKKIRLVWHGTTYCWQRHTMSTLTTVSIR